MERVLSSYLAFIVSAFFCHTVLLSAAVVLSLKLWPWFVLQWVSVLICTWLGWRFPRWIRVFNLTLIDHYQAFRQDRHGQHAELQGEEFLNISTTEAEERLRSEIRELAASPPNS